MWFRRKRRPDPDSALTETLRSLQTLLDDENSIDRRLQQPQTKIPHNTPEPTSAARQVETPPADRALPNRAPATDDPHPEGHSLANDPASGLSEERPEPDPASRPSEERPEPDSASGPSEERPEPDPASRPSGERPEPDSAGQELTPAKPPSTVDWDDSPAIPESEAPAVPGDDMDLLEHPPLDPDDTSDTDAADTIPVLTQVVYEPPKENAVDAAAEKKSRERTEIIDPLIAALARRLEQYGRGPMDSRQEQRLRDLLGSILAD